MMTAWEYTGSCSWSGLVQLGVMARNAIRTTDRVLEIGCGTLQFAKAVMPVVRQYCGIEPNLWLMEAAKNSDPELRALIDRHRPMFDHNTDFDASVFGMTFDHIMSHSVLSHTSKHQMPRLLKNAAAVLADDGVMSASLRLGEDSNDEAWVYPDCSWFSHETICKAAADAGLVAIHQPQIRAWYSSYRPDNIHDWYTFTKVRA